MKTASILLVVCALAFAGCANTPTTTTTTTTPPTTTPSESTSTGPQELAYTATQSGAGNNTTYHFDGPATATAGWTHVTLTNNGSEGHQVVFLKLPAGVTFAQHMTMMMSNDSSGMGMNGTHENATFVGGVASASPLPPPGAPQPPPEAKANIESAWVFLTPGTYVLECEIPGAAGPHALHGMTKELTVTGTAPATSKDEPTSDIGLTLVDFNFTWSGTPTAGHHVIKVENKGSMPHEAVLIHLNANKTIADFTNWERAGAHGPPPATDVFGAGALAPGQVEYVDATFVAGDDYGQICFLPDMVGVPHLAHGMIGQFHVA